NGDRYATAGATLRPEVREFFSGNGSLGGSLSDAFSLPSPAVMAIRQALDMNNLTTGWQPQRPLVVFHSKHDEVVPFVNYERASQAFTGEHFHGVTYDTNVQTHVSTGKSFFTLYLSYYVNTLREGKGNTLPRERNITGKW
ncbi:MAG: hypothetical protein II949_10635, partial [Prevotella sp.]|nr:hypothetical protein [Prevotella sp.]